MVNKKLRSRLVLLGVASMFMIPILVSWYLVFFTDFKKEDGGTQKGEIISPVIPLGELEVYDIKNGAISSINEKWTLVFFVDSECNQFCEDKLYQVRQIRLALGKDRDQVDRLLVSRKVQSWENFLMYLMDRNILILKVKAMKGLLKNLKIIRDLIGVGRT